MSRSCHCIWALENVSIHRIELTFACELSVVLPRALVTAHDALDILILDITDMSSVGTSDRRRSGVIIIVCCVVVVIITRVGSERSVCGTVVHAVSRILLHRQQLTFRWRRLQKFALGLGLREKRLRWRECCKVIICRHRADVIR